MSRTATCDGCGFSGSLGEVSVHDCYVQEMGGRCEDFPACGHTDGDGCQTRPEHTADYWMEVVRREDANDWYDYDGM